MDKQQLLDWIEMQLSIERKLTFEIDSSFSRGFNYGRRQLLEELKNVVEKQDDNSKSEERTRD